MPKPPKSQPNSDIDGIHQDEVRNTDVAARTGQSAKELKEARDNSTGRPPISKSRKDH